MKRARRTGGGNNAPGAKLLTGGSGDVNPQILVLPLLTQSVADTTQLESFPMPIPRLPLTDNSSLVIEILAVWFFMENTGFVAATTTTQTVFLTTNASAGGVDGLGRGAFEDPRTIVQWTRQSVANAAPTSFQSVEAIKYFDMTDSAGHGYLVATDNIFLGVASAATNSTNSGSCKFLYRFKEVSLSEYVGIVQSQQ